MKNQWKTYGVLVNLHMEIITFPYENVENEQKNSSHIDY